MQGSDLGFSMARVVVFAAVSALVLGAVVGGGAVALVLWVME